MKIFTLSLLLVFSSMITKAQQDTMPNPGFENWAQEGGYTDPNDWNCTNPLTNVLGIITCRQDSTVVHSGKYSCNLVTKYISAISSNVPGLLTTGVIPASQTQAISGGQIIHSRPLSVSGWFQYIPAGHDTGGVTITLIKGDSIIGTGAFNFIDTANTWTLFSFNINYTSGSTPDTSQISFVSSVGNGIVNSSLWLDDLSYSYFPAAVTEIKNSQLSIYPNPATNQFSIDNETIRATGLNMYAADGKLVKFYKLHEGLNTLDITGVSGGVYMLSAFDNTGATYHNSLVIEK